MAEPPRWVREGTAGDAVAAAGALLAEHLSRVARERTPRLAIPGGSAAMALVAARERLGGEQAWREVLLTWVDERCVPEASEDSNRGTARRAGLLGEPEPALQLPLFLDGESPASAVARVEARLAGDFAGALDVLLLGMGEDGHVASLFPGSPHPQSPAGRAAWVTASPKPPTERITLTRAMLATSRHTVLLATGTAKREALARLAGGDPALPARGLADLTVVTDVEL